MHLLLISYWYHPEPVAKPHDLAAEMVKRGHRVSVITGFPNYPEGRIYDGYRVRHWQKEIVDGVNILRVPMLVDRSRSGLKRVFSYTSFASAAILIGGWFNRRPDIIWNYQLGLPGIILGRLKRIPVVHEVQDLWPEWSQSGQMGVGGVFYRLLDAQERMIYRNSQALITISGGFKRVLMKKGVPGSKITIIPNWANEKNFHPAAFDYTLAEREGLSNRFNIIYGGNVGTAQALGVILDTAERLRNRPEIQFVIIGDGVERKGLEQEALAKKLTNVRFLGSRLPDQMADYLALADALIIHLKRSPDVAITIPSKTYSYLAVGKPIIAATEGDVAELVKEIGAGIVCPPEDPSALAAAVCQMYKQTPDKRDEMGKKGRHAFLSRFTRQVLVEQYENLFQRTVSEFK